MKRIKPEYQNKTVKMTNGSWTARQVSTATLNPDRFEEYAKNGLAYIFEDYEAPVVIEYQGVEEPTPVKKKRKKKSDGEA